MFKQYLKAKKKPSVGIILKEYFKRYFSIKTLQQLFWFKWITV